LGEFIRCEDTTDATAVADVVVRAADLVHGTAQARPEEIGDFARSVAQLPGVGAVSVLPVVEPAPGGNGRGRTMLLRLPAADANSLLVELCAPGDSGWPGAAQERTVRAVLELVACATDEVGHDNQRLRLRKLVQHLNAAVLVENTSGRTVLANDTFARAFGQADGEGWVNAERHDVLAAVGSQCQDGARVLADLTAIAGTGERCLGYGLEFVNGHSVSLDFVPIADNGIALGALWYLRDVTEATATQHELRERNRVLAEAAELNNHFLAAVSHELRTPLTAVASFTEILRDAESGPQTPVQRTAVDAVARNAERLMRLVNDLLLLTQLERHALPIQRESIDMPELVRQAVADREPDARRAGVSVSVETSDGPPLAGDSVRLHQVLGNLLGNACKFTGHDGKIMLRALFTEPHWVIEVSDTGIGIPEPDLRHITDSFVRGANAISRRLSGSGLGLAISRHIVEQHHGALAIDSVMEQGTTVRVTLPVGHEEPS